MSKLTEFNRLRREFADNVAKNLTGGDSKYTAVAYLDDDGQLSLERDGDAMMLFTASETRRLLSFLNEWLNEDL